MCSGHWWALDRTEWQEDWETVWLERPLYCHFHQLGVWEPYPQRWPKWLCSHEGRGKEQHKSLTPPIHFLNLLNLHNSVLRGTARVYPSARRVKAEGTPWTSCQTTLTLTLVFHQLELTGRILTTPHLTPKHNKESPVDFDACIWTVGGGNPCAYIENSIQKLPGPGKWLATWERQQH